MSRAAIGIPVRWKAVCDELGLCAGFNVSGSLHLGRKSLEWLTHKYVEMSGWVRNAES